MLASDTLADSSQLHKACCTCMQDIVMREAMVMRQQRHPNVLPLLAAFLAEAVLWMVMPYVAGGSAIHILNKRFHGVSCPQGLFCVHQSPHCLQITFAQLACMFSGFLCIHQSAIVLQSCCAHLSCPCGLHCVAAHLQVVSLQKAPPLVFDHI